jgi:uncharacterized protein
MNTILRIFVAAFVWVLLVIMAQAEQSPLPKPSGYVNDYAAVIDPKTKEQLEATLTNLDRQQQIQFAVVTVNTTGGQDIFDYSLAVAREWGIGAKDTQKPSLLLLVAIKDRKYFTQVSRHLEGDLPDGLVGQIQRERLVPAFRAGDYGRGLSAAIHEYIVTVARKNGFSTDTIFSGGAVPELAPKVRSGAKTTILGLGIILIIVIVLSAIFLRNVGGRGMRGGPGGGWLAWFLINALLNSGSRSQSSGWGGGGFGGFSGSSGGGFGGGGFGGFGGGGDFGGGGAGGSW